MRSPPKVLKNDGIGDICICNTSTNIVVNAIVDDYSNPYPKVTDYVEEADI